MRIMRKYITDEKLKTIVYDFDNMDLDLDNMVLEKEHIFSDVHNKKMDALFETWEKEEKADNTPALIKFPKMNRPYKMVAGILVVLLIGMSVIHTDAVLAYANKIRAFVIQEFEKYSLFKVDDAVTIDDNVDLDNFVLEYESDDFNIVYQNKLKSYHLYEYKNSNGNYLYIKILKSKDDLNIFVDTEDSEIISKIIDGIEYKYIEKDEVIRIYYMKDGMIFDIKTNISLENAFKEIKNIK